MFNFESLSHENLEICQKTISPMAFAMLVGDAIKSNKRLSVVRMADGEHHLLKECFDGNPSDFVTGFNDPQWAARYGISDMTIGELKNRLLSAGTECTHFAPSISGVNMPNYKMDHFFPKRDFYVDNFFVNVWSEEIIADLFQAAGHVLMIHRNLHTADAMQGRAKWGLGVRVSFIKIDKWQDTDEVIEQAALCNAPLVLFSGGPAGKYIGPRIANTTGIPKAVLDIGNAMDRFCFPSLVNQPKQWTSDTIYLKPIFEKNWDKATWFGKNK
jgi:hypothetical protein